MVSVLQVICHFVALVLTTVFLLDNWASATMWYIFGFFVAPISAAESYFIVSSLIFGKQKYWVLISIPLQIYVTVLDARLLTHHRPHCCNLVASAACATLRAAANSSARGKALEVAKVAAGSTATATPRVVVLVVNPMLFFVVVAVFASGFRFRVQGLGARGYSLV